jgi:GNAT superfamily N-acetyltransferase
LNVWELFRDLVDQRVSQSVVSKGVAMENLKRLLQGQGIGSQLLRNIETKFNRVAKFDLFTGTKSEANIRLYQRHGYTITRTQPLSQTVSIVFMEKPAQAGL